MTGRLFGVRWRLTEFSLNRELIDFPTVAKDAWFGLNIDGLPLVRTGVLFGKRDLAVGGKPLSRLDDEELFVTSRIVEERYRAMKWLQCGGKYADVDASA